MLTMRALIISTLLAIAATVLANRTDDVPGQKLVCYAELWAGGRPSPANYDLLQNFPPNTCHYLILMYLTLDNSTWTLKMFNGYTEIDPEDIRKAVQLRARSPHMNVLISVGGWEDGVAKYSDMMLRASRRRAFIKSVTEILDAYDLDGLELHWLYPGAVWRGGRNTDKANYLLLVKELSRAFKPKNWILTASIPPDQTNLLAGFDIPALNDLLHQMHLRTLDLRGEWTEAASGHCPLYTSPWEPRRLNELNVNGSVSLLLREGASPSKLIPTFPFYGRSFTLLDPDRTRPGSPIRGPGRQTPYINAAGIMAYFEICDAIQRDHLTRHVQRGAKTPYAVGDNFWVGYDDEKSLRKKVKYLVEKQLGGAAVFALGLDDFNGICGPANFLVNKMKNYLDNLGLDEDLDEDLVDDLVESSFSTPAQELPLVTENERDNKA